METTAEDDKIFNESIRCIRSFNDSLKDLSAFVNEVETSEADLFDTVNGISLLDLKNQLLAQYLIQLCSVFMRKLTGKSLRECNSLNILVEIRIILERIRPLNLKIQYQIDNMLKILTDFEQGNPVSSDNPLNFRANPDNFDITDNATEIKNLEESDGNVDVDENTSKIKELKYVPPKLTPMHYDEDLSTNAKEEKERKRLLKRLSQKEIFQDLQAEFMDTPEEVHHSFSGLKLKERAAIDRRIKYEEETFSRLRSVKRKRAHLNSLMKQNSSLADITDFSGASLLYENSSSKPAATKKKFSSRKKRRTK